MEQNTEEETEPPVGYKESLIGKTVSMALQPYDLTETFPETWDLYNCGGNRRASQRLDCRYEYINR